MPSTAPVVLSDRFGQALLYAFELHRAQRRKISGTPYVAHLLGVAGLVLEYGGNEDTAIAALLHDSVEDQGGAPVREEIRRRFGSTVVEIVDGCTDTDVSPKPPWRERKERQLAHAATARHEVRLVLAADKLHNLRALMRDYRVAGETIWESFRGGRDGTLWYFTHMLASLRHAGNFPLLDDYSRTLDEFAGLLAPASASST
jgi:GTP pyrophosphokinase